MHRERGLILSGAFSGGGLDWRNDIVVESTTDGVDMDTSYPKLPVNVSAICQVTVDDNTVMAFGEKELVSREAPTPSLNAMLNLTTMQWTDLPPLNQNLTNPSCGVAIDKATGKRYVIVATSEETRHYKQVAPNRVNILDVDNMAWREGKNIC